MTAEDRLLDPACIVEDCAALIRAETDPLLHSYHRGLKVLANVEHWQRTGQLSHQSWTKALWQLDPDTVCLINTLRFWRSIKAAK